MLYPNPIDGAHYLDDGAAAYTTARAGKVAGVDRIFDFGADVTWQGVLIFDVLSIVTGSGRSYQVGLELCASNTFSSGVVTAQPFTLSASPGTDGQGAVALSNKIVETKYRYGRIKVTPIGSGASINLQSWLVHSGSFSTISTPELASTMAVIVERFNQATSTFRAWSGGVVNGGPGSDGKYPLADAYGTTYLVDCPAKIISLIASSGGLTKEAIEALPVAVDADVNPATRPEPQFVAVVGAAGSRVLKSIPRDIFTSRKTKDLEPLVGLISEELVPSYNASTGLERSISIREIMRQTAGLLNPTTFGVKADAVTIKKGATVTNGSDVVTLTENLAETSHVGCVIAIGGAVSGGGSLRTTITQRLAANQFRLATAATRNASGQDVVWGTLNTVAMQNALDAALVPGNFMYGRIVLVPNGQILTGSLLYRRRTGLFGTGNRHSMLVRWDDSFFSSTYGQYVTQYQNGTYYYPYFPFYDDPDSALPMYKPTPAPLLANQQGFAYNGVPGIERPSGSRPADIGFAVDADFCAFGDFAIDGQRFTCSRQMTGFEFRGAQIPIPPNTGQKVYWQVDPYFSMSRMHLYNCGWYGAEIYKRASATIQNVEFIANGAAGLLMDGYDCNIATLLAIENAGPGIIAAGTNSNWINMKISYNGQGGFEWLHGELPAHSNLWVRGQGHNWQNARVQESNGPSIFVEGQQNTFSGCSVDDTGCIIPAHSATEISDPTARAAYIVDQTPFIMPVIFLSNGADFTRFNDFGYGAQVHLGENYATHAIYFGRDGTDQASYCSGRIFTKFTDAQEVWYTGAGGSGDYAPRIVGSTGGAIPALLNEGLTVKGNPISTYDPP